MLPALESVLCTEELTRRPSRPLDYERENRALVSLAQALADSPRTVLQALTDTILEVLQVGSAGISLLTEDGERFHWPAIAGQWKSHIGGGTPRDFGPCGDVLDRNCPLLFRHFERRYTYFVAVTPPIEECLLVPFYVEGKAVGTIWAVAHDDRRKFDSEDLRMLVSLGTFASASYQAVEQLHAISKQADERPKAAQAMREMNEALLVSLVRQHELAEQAQQAEQKLHEEERVRQHQLELTDALRVSTVGELATGLAHELNQPLSSILNLTETCSQYVRAGTIDVAKLLGLLSDIDKESVRAAAIVAHLRSFVDKGVAQLEPVDLGEIVSHVPHLLLRKLEQARIAIRSDFPARQLHVDADQIQIEQVIVNLIQNAMDSIEEADGPQRLIELSARAVNGMAEVSVRDTGTGVSEPTAERMFEAFFTTKTKGLGIGLALSRSILEVHRGLIWMEAPADDGPGTVVRFSIPLKGSKRRRKDRTV
jgi:signal transduction histidine kinase